VSELRLKARSPGTSALLLAAVLLLSAAGGFLARRLSAPHPATLVPAPTVATPITTAAGAASAASPVRSVPDALPQLALAGLDGASHRLTDWKGRPVIVNFWATWCDPCLREIPLLKSLRREHASEALQVVGIAVDSDEAAREYARAHGIDYPVLMGQQGGLAAVSAFGMDTVLPFSVFADREGRILALKVGELRRDEAELILRGIHEVDVGTLTVVGARERISTGLRRLGAARGTPAS
jgi:thiol-disulfide isomerase/thioredoxin